MRHTYYRWIVLILILVIGVAAILTGDRYFRTQAEDEASRRLEHELN